MLEVYVKLRWIIPLILLAVVGFAYSQFCIFVIAPIGAVPEGRTLVISRLSKLRTVDSADGLCSREFGGVSILCRGMTLAKVAKEAKTYVRLPYSKTLYLMSTNGQEYDR
jgi:hypothetical protein